MPARKKIEADPAARAGTIASFPVPDGSKDFRAGYRECLAMYALHAPDRKNAGKILERHCIVLEDACMSGMTRENVAQYEGYRQAIKDLKKGKKIR